jgi:tRNA(Arg) A34 adenosine deaminase TadA
MNRRKALACFCGLALSPWIARSKTAVSLSAIPLKTHEQVMRVAMKEALRNSMYPFAAVITNAASGKILAKGVNNSAANPTLHGEIACVNHYVEQYGNNNWSNLILYTTGEPCPMCMGALIWAGIGGVVYASSCKAIAKSGIDQIDISAKEVIAASHFWRPELLGGVLEKECDALFMNRKRS